MHVHRVAHGLAVARGVERDVDRATSAGDLDSVAVPPKDKVPSPPAGGLGVLAHELCTRDRLPADAQRLAGLVLDQDFAQVPLAVRAKATTSAASKVKHCAPLFVHVLFLSSFLFSLVFKAHTVVASD